MVKKAKKVGSKLEPEFLVGDLVAAKVKGYPAWPARIEQVDVLSNNRKRYHVRFFCTNDKSSSCISIKPFEDMTPSELKSSRKLFSEAVALCRAEQNSSKRNRISKRAQEAKTAEPEELDTNDEAISTQQEETSEKSKSEVSSPEHSASVQDEPIDSCSPSTQESDEGIIKLNNINSGGDEAHALEQKDALSKGGEQADELASSIEDESIRPNCLNGGNVRETKSSKMNVNDNIEEKDNDLLNDSSPENDDRQILLEPKSEETSKDCSLNDLTSEQANADRGSKLPITKANMQATKKELTLAKLKKKIESKLIEKEEKKKARLEQKSFEKASKHVPTITQVFDSLDKSSALLLKDLSNAKATVQFRMSMKKCEKFLDSLAKCITLMTSDHGAKRRELHDLHHKLIKIVETLIQIRHCESLQIASECRQFIKCIKRRQQIKNFLNSQMFHSYGDTIAEKKENSRKKHKKRKQPIR